jgi:hypothetical protein
MNAMNMMYDFGGLDFATASAMENRREESPDGPDATEMARHGGGVLACKIGEH